MASDFEVPVAKRPKLETVPNSKRTGSRLFTPFRTIGLVSPTDVPFTAVPLGKTTFQITTSVGRSLQTYDLRRGLNLVFLSRPRCPASITATCAYRDRVFVAWGSEQANCGSGVWVFKRGRQVDTFDSTSVRPQAIKKLLVLGNWVIGCGQNTVEVWKNDSYEHYTTLTPTRPALVEDAVLSGVVCSLPTFLNKIFVGRVDGAVEIYNVSTGKLLHTILPPSASAGHVTALSSTTALSMLAIAYADGSLVIIDVETEDVLTTLHQSNSDRPITTISFRSDGSGAGDDGRLDGVLATASIESGDVTLWDLTKGGKIAGVLRGAHQTSSTKKASGITAIEFLPGQPVLVSSGLDNSLKTWVFDHTPFSATPRILHSRSGHAAPISTLKFLPAASDGSDVAGKWLLSAAQDRSLWGFSLRRDGQSTEISQGNVKHKAKKSGKLLDDQAHVEDLKCPPVTAIACSLNRDGGMGAVGGPVWTNPSVTKTEESNLTGWESIVTAHENDKFARTWFWGRKKAGRWAFESGDHKPVSTVTITACGTFAIIGSAGGAIDTFNLQSGAHRQRFPPRLTPSQAKQLKLQSQRQEEQQLLPKGHSATVTGLVVDNMNQSLVSTALDGQVIFWDFVSGNIIHRLNLEDCSVTAVKYNPVSGLVSMACDDLCVRVVDIETKRIVRELWGSVGQIYDHCFSHDGRWIVTSSMDSVVRVFDLATGHLIDAFKAGTCTNLAFSSTGEYLATAHAGEIGVNIWNNKSLYTHISSRQVNEDTGIIDLSEGLDFEGAVAFAIEDEMVTEADFTGIDVDSAMEQLDASLLTLSLVPSSKWQTLLNLESIRQRNKPIQPPQKPKAAPFFLGSTLMNGQIGQMEEEPAKEDKKSLEVDKSRISRLTSLQPIQNELSSHLQQFSSNVDHNPSELIVYLSSLSPAATDLEIRSLSIQEMPTFIHALTMRLLQRRDFELVNTWMAVFLKVHSEFVSEVKDVQEAVLEFRRVMNAEEARLSRSVGWARGVVEFLRSAR